MSYQCEQCGYRSSRWMGFCPQCRNEGALAGVAGVPGREVESASLVPLSNVVLGQIERRPLGLPELDRVLGGGLVPGAAVLLGGEPGVGKSTLMLQAAGTVVAAAGSVVVASAEESAEQVALRARRLRIDGERLLLVSESDVDAIVAAAAQAGPDLLVVDSIQTVFTGEVDGSPGGVAQVRSCGAKLVALAKRRGIAVLLVGHVTKDGTLAGPKVLEHMVDVVLYLEGDADHGVRFVRGLKNRFGGVNEIGLFEMTATGLVEVDDPSQALIHDRVGDVPGTVLFPTVEGRRPLLVEVQALVAKTNNPQPRRSVKGIEAARLHQLLAVLDRHAGLEFGDRDVYVSMVGGVRIREPAADLPVALALASSLLERPVGGLAAWGEIGLTGELRPVPHADRRRGEAERLGIATIVAAGRRGPQRIADALRDGGLWARSKEASLTAV